MDFGLACDDPLTYLPRKPLQEFGKGRVIFGNNLACDHLYAVVLGRVKITSASEGEFKTVGRIVSADGLFGESVLIGSSTRESAVALDNVRLMSWTADEVEQQVEREPRLGVALSQHLVRQCLELQDRIESMAVYKTPERVTLALVQLAGILGTPMPDGTVRIASLTHQTIAEFVGTSREIVTSQMNRLRRTGVLRYSRKYIDINVQAVREALRQQGVNTQSVAGEIAHAAG